MDEPFVICGLVAARISASNKDLHVKLYCDYLATPKRKPELKYLKG